jgi:hypothetical protein
VPAAGKPSKPSGPSKNHEARQQRPIQLGVSGGNATDSANGYCCSGTLGALVADLLDPTKQYILSNTHVFAHDITEGDADGVAEIGDPIDQPGLVDVKCGDRPADYVAHLSEWAELKTSANVDAAIAEVLPGAVDSDGRILEVGTIAATPVPALINQRVKKSGRTTGLTSSSVTDINVTIQVRYTDECGPATDTNTFWKTFTGQIFVQNQIMVHKRSSSFLAAGDSGSLMVQDLEVNPAPIGLLFAGSSTVAVANPIQDVLDFFRELLDRDIDVVGVSGLGAIEADEAPPRSEVARAKRAQERHAKALLEIPRGVGHGIGLDNGRVVIKVFVEEITDEARRAVPDSLDGVPVVLEAVGRIIAF